MKAGLKILDLFWEGLPGNDQMEAFAAGEFDSIMMDAVLFEGCNEEFGCYFRTIEEGGVDVDEEVPSGAEGVLILRRHVSVEFEWVGPVFL